VSQDPGDAPIEQVVVGGVRYRVGARLRLRVGVEGPDAGFDGRAAIIETIHFSGAGHPFLGVALEAEANAPGGRRVYVAPSQVDLL
jgi:hypothetical protein